MKFHFKHVIPSQRELVHRWLAQDHIQAWLHGTGLKNTLEDLDNFFKGHGMYQHWIAYMGEAPFAYLITSEEGKEAITLDLFICVVDYLGKGLAPPMIREFLLKHFRHKKQVFIDPEANNSRAIHVYEKVGFRIVEEFIATWHPVLHYKMQLDMKTLESSEED